MLPFIAIDAQKELRNGSCDSARGSAPDNSRLLKRKLKLFVRLLIPK